MKFISHAFPFGALALGYKLLKGPKSPDAPLPPATRDDAQAAADKRQELARRRGGAADIVTGALGADATGGSVGKTTLGS